MKFCVYFTRRLGIFLLLCLSGTAFAGPGDGVHIGPLVVSPYLDLNFTDDSNVYKDGTNEIQDTFFEPELGLRFSSSSDTNLLSIRGNLFYSDRGYSDETLRDFETYGDNITLRYGNGRRSLVEVIQSYRSLDDYDRHAADIESSSLAGEMIQDAGTLDLQRDINQLGASLMRRMSDKLELGLSYRYSGVHYDNQTQERLQNKQEEYVPQGLDLDGNILQLDGSLGLTDKTDAILTLRQGIEYQEGYEEPAKFTTLRIGLKTQQAEKLVYTIGGGVERYTRRASMTSYYESLNQS